MDLSELVNKPIEEMTEEELQKLESIGQREYNRKWRENNRDKNKEIVKRARIKKGLRTLKESGGNHDEVQPPKLKASPKEPVNQASIIIEEDFLWINKTYRIKSNVASAFKECAAQNRFTQTAALEEALRDWIAKNQ